MTGFQINIKSHSFSVLTKQVTRPAGSPGASGTYPLAILSDEETEAGGSAGRPMRAHSLRNALQSWRSIRTALGDRHASHASAFAAAAGTSGDADEEAAPAQVRLCCVYTVHACTDAAGSGGKCLAIALGQHQGALFREPRESGKIFVGHQSTLSSRVSILLNGSHCKASQIKKNLWQFGSGKVAIVTTDSGL